MIKYVLSLLLIAFTICTCNAQTEPASKGEKNLQGNLQNEFYFTYGLGSIYYFINQNTTNNTSPGCFIAGYTRSITNVVGVGFQAAYTQVTYREKNSTSKTISNYLQALARVSFRYMNKPAFCMYSGVAVGITYQIDTEKSGSSNGYRQLLPAGQLTLLGFRLGRSMAFCGEFGVGSLSILNLGITYKFGD